MSDSSSLLPNREALPDDCNFSLKANGVRARSYRSSILPTNGTSFGAGGLAVLYVPGGRRNTYLDTTQTYIRYTIQNNDATAASSGQNNDFYLDNTGACVINRLDCFHSSNLLESVQAYNILYNYITDANMNSSQKLGLSSAYGTVSTVGSLVGTPAAGTTAIDNSRQGQLVKGVNYIASTSTAINQQVTVAMPILSGVIGLGSDKYLPIGKLLDDIRLEITFENAASAVVYTNTAIPTTFKNSAIPSPFVITDIQLELCIVELSDAGEMLVNEMASPERPIYLHHNSWRHYVSTLNSGAAGQYSTLVPARFGSLKSLLLTPRPSIYSVASTYSLSARANPNFATYNWRVGSNLIPSKNVVLENATTTGGYAEAFMELQKSWHSISSAQNASNLPISIYNVCDNSLSAYSYTPVTAIGTVANTKATCTGTTTAVSTPGSTWQYGFAIHQECESFANKTSVLMSGMNTLSSQVFFETQINNPTSTGAYTLDFFANYDGIVVLENGIMSVRF
jgi:hypothetical protein